MRTIAICAVVVAILVPVTARGPWPAEPAAAGQSSLPGSPRPVPIPPGRQVFYEIDQVPWLEFGPGTRRRTVLGEGVTFSLAELDPQFVKGRDASQGHHHDYEQILFGWAGVYDQSAGDRTCRVARMTACLEPPNVQHTVTGVHGPEKVVTIEVLPIARRDLLPPRPSVTYPASPRPRPVPEGMEVFADFNAMPWAGEPGQGRFKALIGETSSLVLWHLPAAGFRGASAPGHHHDVEQISYVLDGRADVRVGDQVRRVGPGTLIMIPSNVEHLPMSAVNGEDVLLLDFQPVARHDLLERLRKR
jgi:quercetin dioxygenase-like cupin family protein